MLTLLLIPEQIDVCLMRKLEGKIGLEIEKGERETFSGIESGEIVAYLHKIKLQIIGIEKIVELDLKPGLPMHQAFLPFWGKMDFLMPLKLNLKKITTLLKLHQ